jgi:ankyrin repeat protein
MMRGVMAQSDDNWFEQEQLHFAASDGDLDKVKELIEKGYDVNTFDADLAFTPLHYSVRGEFLEVTKYLLKNGANVNAHDEDKIGETPLGDVAATCSFEMAELLVKVGANPTIPGWMQITALHRAQNRKKEEGKKVYELLAKTAKDKFNFAP